MKTLTLFTFLFSLTVFSQGKIENLKIDWPEEYEWVIGTNQENESMHMIELIPKSQTLQDWKIIGTMISIKGITNLPMDVYIQLMHTQMKERAPKAKLTVLEKDETGKNHWALFTLESPRFNNDPKPESQLYYVIQGDSSLYSNLVAVKEKKLSKEFIEEWSAVFKASELVYQ
jgi:hypothetical protein